MSTVRITHIGGPTTLIEVGGWRLLTDPTFDPPGRRYAFGWGTSSTKVTGPAVTPAELGRIDAVLLTHDHHGDNLDDLGRAMLPGVGTVLTTAAGARRLGESLVDRLGDAATGLAPWATTTLTGAGRPAIEVTATPCRHGPPLSRPIVGDVIGFALRWDGQRHGQLWISGDTVRHKGTRAVADRMRVGTVILHLGGVRFPITGPLRYTMTGRDAVEVCRAVRPHTVIPVHYEGWRHFRQPRAAAEREFAGATDDIRRSVRWLEIGTATEITV